MNFRETMDWIDREVAKQMATAFLIPPEVFYGGTDRSWTANEKESMSKVFHQLHTALLVAGWVLDVDAGLYRRVNHTLTITQHQGNDEDLIATIALSGEFMPHSAAKTISKMVSICADGFRKTGQWTVKQVLRSIENAFVSGYLG